ncbi:unnamed protein product [Orchesella dallaii]|uniref:Uncharacterized protein n=1 Tax=Orchesella dallaii TaxID=48710 RepID=A0ABP1Q2N8_9HEXA
MSAEVENAASSLDRNIDVNEEDGSLLILSRVSDPEPDEMDQSFDSIGDLFSFMNEHNPVDTDTDDDTNSRSIMELDELIDKERQNLDMLKLANTSILEFVTASSGVVVEKMLTPTTTQPTSEKSDGVAGTTDVNEKISPVAADIPIPNTSSDLSKNPDTIPGTTGELTKVKELANSSTIEEKCFNNQEKDIKKTEIGTTIGQKPSQNLFRGVPTFRRRKAGQRNVMAVNDFIKDYYRSLDTVSRYIIIASILSFVTAFTLLYFHGYQTHQHNMELFNMKEKQTQAQLEHYEVSKRQSTNFRETIIHQRYEETRQCQVSLNSCSANNEALSTKIGKVEKDCSVQKLKLETELKSKEDRIKVLQEVVKKLEKSNQELRVVASQTAQSSLAQISVGFLNLLKNPLVYGYTLALGAVLFVIMACASK